MSVVVKKKKGQVGQYGQRRCLQCRMPIRWLFNWDTGEPSSDQELIAAIRQEAVAEHARGWTAWAKKLVAIAVLAERQARELEAHEGARSILIDTVRELADHLEAATRHLGSDPKLERLLAEARLWTK